ncbi:MAG: TetR family transcriptional regulator [Nevskiaceae bacterium]|nr:MAG: TetR family transcriptional regulator [Nevskiaceae bacterium]TAM27278.1 MAG: TetR family transcriptional regulator [Nevskiaceae bacterium]
MAKSDLPSPEPLRSRNKLRIRQEIAAAAMGLAVERGLSNFTADDIAASAQVGRATFFRYFDSKESAVVVGFYESRLKELVETLGRAPPKLGPVDALIWSFLQLGTDFEKQSKLMRLLATMLLTSPSLRAKALDYQASYEQAIAAAIAGRYENLAADDLRPRWLAASTLAVSTTCVYHWSASEAPLSLPDLVIAALEQLKAGFDTGRVKSKARATRRR